MMVGFQPGGRKGFSGPVVHFIPSYVCLCCHSEWMTGHICAQLYASSPLCLMICLFRLPVWIITWLHCSYYTVFLHYVSFYASLGFQLAWITGCILLSWHFFLYYTSSCVYSGCRYLWIPAHIMHSCKVFFSFWFHICFSRLPALVNYCSHCVQL